MCTSCMYLLHMYIYFKHLTKQTNGFFFSWYSVNLWLKSVVSSTDFILYFCLRIDFEYLTNIYVIASLTTKFIYG